MLQDLFFVKYVLCECVKIVISCLKFFNRASNRGRVVIINFLFTLF